MYGVTEIESVDLLGPVALNKGMLEKERDEELRKYFRVRCEKNSEHCLTHTLKEYKKYANDESQKGLRFNTNEALEARNILLDMLTDARTVAPVIQTGCYHSTPNIQSYFYVFTHKTHSKNYIVSNKLILFQNIKGGYTIYEII